ncbi:MAG: protein kinase [Bryobacteraceae bacterium]|nr:protein kinase [Bryobacteraceae bacterium]
MDYEIGSRAGDYRILDVLGAGGMGKVYKVQNVISDRIEAMKVLLPNLEGDSELADRFVREIKVQARLDHPNIAALHTALRLDNQLVMLMEFVEGVTLEHLLKSGPIPIDKAVDYVGQVLSALSYAHAHGVVHRDIKPANMILTPQGVIKLMDFGIAKLTADHKLTQTGATVGSLYYMSPEQIKGATDLDARSDLYSLGVALYEIVTGARPFQGDSEYSIMSAHLEKTPVPLLQIDPSLPDALNAVVLMSIEKDPAKRFQTADAFRTALMSVVPHAAASASQGAPQAAPRPAPVPFSAPMTPPPAQPAVTAQAGGHRGRYLILGSVVTLAVLVVAGTQAPKFWHKSQPAEASPAPVSVPAANSDSQAAPPVTEPVQQAPAQAVPATPQSSMEQHPQQRTASSPRPQAGQPASKPAATQQGVQTQAQPSNQPIQQSAPPPAPAAQAAAPAISAADAAALNEAREQLPQLEIRASAVRSGLESLQRSQSKQGLNLRTDIVATAQRMDFQLNAAGDALKRGDAASAKKSLDAAEHAVSKLESFLGH